MMSAEIRSCCLMPRRRAWAPGASLFSPQCLHICPWGVCWLKAPQGEACAGPYSGQREDVATVCWDERGGRGASCKHLNCRDTVHGVGACPSVLQWLPRKFANRRREMAESCCHRALAFPAPSPCCCCPQSWGGPHIVCPGEGRTWVHAGELLLGGQRSWR